MGRKADRRKLFKSLVIAAALAGCGPGEQPSNQAAAEQQPETGFARTSADPLVHGKRLATVLGCSGCHGSDLTGKDWSDPEWGTLWTSNLTRAAPRYTDAQLENAIRRGRRHDGSELWAMPSHLFTQLNAGEMKELIAWLRTHAPAGDERPLPILGPRAKREIAAGTWRSSAADVERSGDTWPPDGGGGTALGRYIVRATCAECHGLDLQGPPEPQEDRPPPPLANAAAYDRQQFRHLLRTGEPVGGRELRLMGEVARGRYAHMTDSEVDAVYDYLRAVAAKD